MIHATKRCFHAATAEMSQKAAQRMERRFLNLACRPIRESGLLPQRQRSVLDTPQRDPEKREVLLRVTEFTCKPAPDLRFRGLNRRIVTPAYHDAYAEASVSSEWIGPDG